MGQAHNTARKCGFKFQEMHSLVCGFGPFLSTEEIEVSEMLNSDCTRNNSLELSLVNLAVVVVVVVVLLLLLTLFLSFCKQWWMTLSVWIHTQMMETQHSAPFCSFCIVEWFARFVIYCPVCCQRRLGIFFPALHAWWLTKGGISGSHIPHVLFTKQVNWKKKKEKNKWDLIYLVNILLNCPTTTQSVSILFFMESLVLECYRGF